MRYFQAHKTTIKAIDTRYKIQDTNLYLKSVLKQQTLAKRLLSPTKVSSTLYIVNRKKNLITYNI